jgi:6,7-dimethyl-8-ribityllumazine synthase
MVSDLSGEPFASTDEKLGAGLRIAIVVSRFNDDITGRLLGGAREALAEHGVAEADVEVVWVPGAFELPLVAKRLAETHRYDAAICIGAVIKHETAHWHYVAEQAAAGIQRAALDTGVPCMFNVLTCETHEQALARSGGDKGNRGYDSAIGAMETARLLRSLRVD